MYDIPVSLKGKLFIILKKKAILYWILLLMVAAIWFCYSLKNYHNYISLQNQRLGQYISEKNLKTRSFQETFYTIFQNDKPSGKITTIFESTEISDNNEQNLDFTHHNTENSAKRNCYNFHLDIFICCKYKEYTIPFSFGFSLYSNEKNQWHKLFFSLRYGEEASITGTGQIENKVLTIHITNGAQKMHKKFQLKSVPAVSNPIYPFLTDFNYSHRNRHFPKVWRYIHPLTGKAVLLKKSTQSVTKINSQDCASFYFDFFPDLLFYLSKDGELRSVEVKNSFLIIQTEREENHQWNPLIISSNFSIPFFNYQENYQ